MQSIELALSQQRGRVVLVPHVLATPKELHMKHTCASSTINYGGSLRK